VAGDQAPYDEALPVLRHSKEPVNPQNEILVLGTYRHRDRMQLSRVLLRAKVVDIYRFENLSD